MEKNTNSLEPFLRRWGIDERMAMNLLQSAGGIISDECVWWEDVGEQDQYWAIKWLEKHFSPENGKGV
jgi:hypothetical protein